jgi:hypothetical protein
MMVATSGAVVGAAGVIVRAGLVHANEHQFGVRIQADIIPYGHSVTGRKQYGKYD